jgi:hypothetical protein
MLRQQDPNDDDDDDDVSMTSNNNYSTTVFEEPYRYSDEDRRSSSQSLQPPRQQHVSHSSIPPRHVLRACKVRGWTIQPDALQAMLDTIQSVVDGGGGGDGSSENHHQNFNHRVSTNGKNSIGIPSIINNYLDQLQPYMVTTARSEDGDHVDDDDDTTHPPYRNNRRTKNPTMITRMIWKQMIRACHDTSTSTTTAATVPRTLSANMTQRATTTTTAAAPSRALLDIQASTNKVSRRMNSSSSSSSTSSRRMMMTPTTTTTTHHFRIISAFDTPQLIYDMTRKQFHVQSMQSSSSSSLPLLLGSAEDKVMNLVLYQNVEQKSG